MNKKKRIRRITINKQKQVKFAVQDYGDRYISREQPDLSKLYSEKGIEYVEMTIMKMVFEHDIVFNGHDKSLSMYEYAYENWLQFYYSSDKSEEILREIRRNVLKEIEEEQTCTIKTVNGYYAGFYTVNGNLCMYDTTDIAGAEIVYFKNELSAKKILQVLKTAENYENYKPKIIKKTNIDNTEGADQIINYCKKKGFPTEYVGFRRETFSPNSKYTEIKKYNLCNASYKLDANVSSNRYTLYFKGLPILNCNKQKEVIDFIEEYCPNFPVNIGKTTKFALYLKEVKNKKEEIKGVE